MTLNTNELLSIHAKQPQSIYNVKAQFDITAKRLVKITATVVLGGIFFSDINVELPKSNTEGKAFVKTFLSRYNNMSMNDMPNDGILCYDNFPPGKPRVTRPTLYMSM